MYFPIPNPAQAASNYRATLQVLTAIAGAIGQMNVAFAGRLIMLKE